MTALPKHWPSSRRQGKRRASIHKKLSSVSSCLACGKTKRPGFACPACGKTTKQTKK